MLVRLFKEETPLFVALLNLPTAKIIRGPDAQCKIRASAVARWAAWVRSRILQKEGSKNIEKLAPEKRKPQSESVAVAVVVPEKVSKVCCKSFSCFSNCSCKLLLNSTGVA